jgi:hypothetical protein
MKRIIRTRTITKTSRRLVVCHENFAATGEPGEPAPVHCPNCGELILPLSAAAKPELTGALDGSETPGGED